jgi:hypothetical protein
MLLHEHYDLTTFMPGTDTVVLTQARDDFKVHHRNSLIIQPHSYSTGSIDSKKDGSASLFTDDLGHSHLGYKAFYNFETKCETKKKSETLVAISIGEYGLKVQCSLPRMLHGVNKYDFDPRETGRVLTQLEAILKGAGISTNLTDARVSRLDIAQNSKCKYGYELYAPFVAQINNNRSQLVTYSNTYMRTGNKTNQVCFYAKDEREKLYRMEARLLTGKSVKAMAKKVGEITPISIADPDLLRAIYNQSVTNKLDLVKTQQKFISMDNKELLITYLIQKGYQDWFYEKNRLALELMEIEGIELKTREATVIELLSIQAKALNSVLPTEYLTTAIAATMGIIDGTSKSKGSARVKKMRMRRKLEKQQPEFFTDESKRAISSEFIEKFLTV